MVRHAVIYKSCSAQFTYAAIAQPVERILGKDEVASSNLASSSKKRLEPQQVLGVAFFVLR